MPILEPGCLAAASRMPLVRSRDRSASVSNAPKLDLSAGWRSSSPRCRWRNYRNRRPARCCGPCPLRRSRSADLRLARCGGGRRLLCVDGAGKRRGAEQASDEIGLHGLSPMGRSAVQITTSTSRSVRPEPVEGRLSAGKAPEWGARPSTGSGRTGGLEGDRANAGWCQNKPPPADGRGRRRQDHQILMRSAGAR